MNEKKSRKEWLKTIAIIFLSVLLVLTFFSNTIRNYSLPEVAAQYCYSGQITNKVRGQGTISADDPYSVLAAETRTIESVAVSVGDEVQKGDVLFFLEEGESTELEEAQKTLESLQSAYEKAVITGQISSSITSAVENGTTGTLAENQAKIESYNKKINAYENEVKKYDNLISLWENGTPEQLPERKALNEAKNWASAWEQQVNINAAALANAKTAKESATDEYNAYIASRPEDISGDDVTGNDLLDKKQKAEQKYADCLAADTNGNNQVVAAKNNVIQLQKTIDDNVASFKYQKAIAESNLANAEQQLTEFVSTLTTQLSLEDQVKSIKKQEELIRKLSETQGGIEVVAPVSGTVVSLNYVAGEKIEKGQTVATIQMAGKGYSLSMSVTNEQAKLIAIGDEAEITNSWWYTDVHARVTSIRPDPSNPSKNKLVVFEVEGDVANGQTISITVGKRTSNYDYIVPSSAIKEDNNGKFIYRVKSKNTPLGTRYSVERVDVTVVASDETDSAISGALEDWEYIVTTASKPLEDGALVRLKD